MEKEPQFWQQLLKQSGTALDPVSRLLEIIFGLIMVLSFTMTISITHSGEEELNYLLWAALGCNVAWGIIDGIMFIISELLNRGHGVRLLHELRRAGDPETAVRIVKDEIQPLFRKVMPEDHVNHLYQELMKLPRPPRSAPLIWPDLKGAFFVFLLVFLATFPVTLPFIFVEDVWIAKRVSNGIALLILFTGGFRLGKYSGFNPWLTGMCMMILGVVMVLITLWLGG